ncbi:MAG: hypothetical protein P8X51_14665 [Maritimibacter sp.]
MIEPERTNLVLWPRASSAHWRPVGTTKITDLALNAFRMLQGISVANDGQIWHRAKLSDYSYVAGTTYSASVWYAGGTANNVRMAILDGSAAPITNLALEGAPDSIAAVISSGGTISNIRNTALDGGIWRLTFSFVTTADATAAWGVGPGSTVVGEDVVVLGMQVEMGDASTGYIDASGSPASRMADMQSLSATEWYGAAAGTIGLVAPSETYQDDALLELVSAS